MSQNRYTDTRGIMFLKLLLVIALLAVGIAVVASSFGEIQKRARDSRRLSDVSQLQKALGIYYTNETRFPIESREVVITGDDTFSKELKDEFTAKRVPADPLHPT